MCIKWGGNTLRIITGEAAVKTTSRISDGYENKRRQKEYRPKQKPRIRSWKLIGENLARIKHEVQEKMNEAGEVTWEKLKSSIAETAKNVCGVTRGQK